MADALPPPRLRSRIALPLRDRARCSTTDAEATVMRRADGGFRPAYNVPYAADTASLVIAGVDVLTTGSDQGQMTPIVEQIPERHGAYPATPRGCGPSPAG